MKRFALAVCFGFLGLVGCQSTTRSGQTRPSSDAARDGRSYESAIVIVATSQGEGIREEYAWLKAHFPGSRPADIEKVGEEEVVFGHHTDAHDGHLFSVHNLVLSDGSIRSVYFDITSYFGRAK